LWCEVQMAVRKVAAPAAIGGNILEVAERMLVTSPHRARTHFAVHGKWLVTHEAHKLLHQARRHRSRHRLGSLSTR
jgi:hypothetical protein